jgi:serine/threonine protein kinase
MSCILRGQGIYVWSDWFLISNYSLLPLTRYYYYYYYIKMGFKQTYRDIVHKQPPSFTKKKEYQIKKTIGRGGTGKVVLAIHNKDKIKSKAAIKCVFSFILRVDAIDE